MYIKIKNIEHLKELSSEEWFEGFVALNGGARSSKTIQWNDEFQVFTVLNGIDGSTDNFTEKELEDSIIGEAIKKKAFYKY